LKILTVLGARPQFIKSAIISNHIINSSFMTEIIVHTGQHFEHNMSDIFFQEMNLPRPNYNLGINQMNRKPMIEKMIEKLCPILISEAPDALLVYGDTNSTLAGSLAAKKIKIPIFHVESGLRSFNKSMPEELNRVKTDQLSSLLFCPTENAINNLQKEGISEGVILSGDVMYDIYRMFSKKNKNFHALKLQIDSDYIVSTIHRQENTDNEEKLRSIFSSLDMINKKIKVVLPLHPRTKLQLKKFNIKTDIEWIEPLGYLSMLSLIKSSEMVITDSGGLQKEAFFAKKKCITVRKETEWTELIDIDVNRLSNTRNLFSNFQILRKSTCDFSKKLFGDGNASKVILESIISYFD
tara:strand:- start:14010 stop:15068 length:1059 start_codon:yes stop_codon:yes gene_type:complete